MSGEIVSVIVEFVKHGIEFLAQNKDAIEAGKSALDVTKTAGGWTVKMVESLFPAFAQHYLGTPDAAQEAAAGNVLNVSSKLRDLLAEAMADGSLTSEQIESAVSDPAFSVLFKTALLKASESSSELRQDQFAQLIVAQMSKPSGSHAAQVLTIATRLLPDLSDKQLLLLGAITVALHVSVEPVVSTGQVDADLEEYAKRCQFEVEPYLNAEIRNDDLRYLAALNLLTFNSRLEDRQVSPMLNEIGMVHVIPATHRKHAVFTQLDKWISGDRQAGKHGLGETSLTQPGWVLGAAVDAQLKNRRLDISNISD